MSAMRSHRENAEGSVTLPVRGEPDPAEITEDRAMSGDAEQSADLFHGDFSGAAPAAEPAENALDFVTIRLGHGERAVLVMPSTSPANASWSFERKLEAWSELLKYL